MITHNEATPHPTAWKHAHARRCSTRGMPARGIAHSISAACHCPRSGDSPLCCDKRVTYCVLVAIQHPPYSLFTNMVTYVPVTSRRWHLRRLAPASPLSILSDAHDIEMPCRQLCSIMHASCSSTSEQVFFDVVYVLFAFCWRCRRHVHARHPPPNAEKKNVMRRGGRYVEDTFVNDGGR